MSLDSVLSGEYLEYFIIGTHTSIWIALLLSWILNIPLSQMTSVNVLIGVLLIPFVYLLGLLMDSVSQLFLRQLRGLIRDSVLRKAGITRDSSDSSQSDEALADASPTLYAGYDWRMRRSKVVGAAIFNWIALGSTALAALGTLDSYTARVIAAASITLTAWSVFSWVDLTFRAYSYLSKSLAVIASKQPVSH